MPNALSVSSSEPRRCVVCLKLCKQETKLLCGKCRRRAYCSRKCQKVDWWPGGKGSQGHKNWCHLDCGEEDIDWQVVSVQGKGLGVVAKRLIPAMYRIIVETVYTDPLSHPGNMHIRIPQFKFIMAFIYRIELGIMDLVPEGGSLEEKFNKNALASSNELEASTGKKGYVALRISRVNHNCDSNAGRNYDDGASVEILYAQRDIQPGEEVCISYCSFNNISIDRRCPIVCSNWKPANELSAEEEFACVKSSLESNWGIKCPADCFCNNPIIKSLVVRARQLRIDVDMWAYSQHKPDRALKVIKDLLIIQEKIHSSLISKAKTHYTAYELASSSSIIDNSKSIITKQHILYVYNVCSAICPYSANTATCFKVINDLLI